MSSENCAYCAEGALVEKFGIKIAELPASKVYLFKEQSHRGRVIVASKRHVSEVIDLDRRERQAFMDDVAFQEATILLKAMKHLEGSGVATDAFIKTLGEVRADGVITKEESEKVLKLLDELLA